jgi:DNA-directed RNA polymerase specialized sigma subunit
MSMTRQERERAVLDLYYNQRKSIREIAKEARISFRDIGAILNRQVKIRKQNKGKNTKRAPRKTKNSSLYLHKPTSYFMRIRLQ